MDSEGIVYTRMGTNDATATILEQKSNTKAQFLKTVVLPELQIYKIAML